MHPIKFYEYMAAGLPVVATELDELKPYSDLVHIAHNADEFVALVESALVNNSQAMIEKRISFARENSWEQRSSVIAAYIDRCLN